jgi:hypothetical protein
MPSIRFDAAERLNSGRVSLLAREIVCDAVQSVARRLFREIVIVFPVIFSPAGQRDLSLV